ncbi:MAG: diaminopimelate epimerase [Betaproteobacteria bacterium]|nr:diaminopimelate epimerase [Betaproteobacteria bacterium]
MRFYRYHAIGNDYIVIPESELTGPLTPALTRRICHRNYGVGSDGILLYLNDKAGDRFELRIYNPDGSESEKSGNGLRIFARYLWDRKRVRGEAFEAVTPGGTVTCKVTDDGRSVTVDMGTLTFDSARIPVAGPAREVLRERFTIGGVDLEYSCASIGNPHCVILRDALSEAETRALGPLIEVDRRFPNRTNVQFVQVLDRANIAIQIWERGAGFTLASGSSSSAAAGVAHRLGLCDGDIAVHMPGGTIRIEIDPRFQVRMTGPVTHIADGEIDPECLEGAA